jgi:hypothetical protein
MEEFRMKLPIHMLVFATLATAAVAFSQNPVTLDHGYQVRYAANLITGFDSVIDITNTGGNANNVGPQIGQPPQTNINGSLCVNIYTFAADEQEVACCSCLVTPNALWSASVKTALLNSTLTPSFPNEVVIKLISTNPNVGPNNALSCNPATVPIPAGGPGAIIADDGQTPGAVARGLLAWGTTSHGIPTAVGPSFALTETPFLPATLTVAELTRDVQECQFIQILGSGQFGICKGCANSGLGASAQ